MNLKPILHTILEDYALPLGGDHALTIRQESISG